MVFNELTKEIQLALTEGGFSIPTPIQKMAIPIILQRKDLIGIAQTGTGKTASFVLPLLQLVSTDAKKIEPNSPLVLVLSPTRELAIQIDDTFRNFGKFLNIKHEAIYGGVNKEPQIKTLNGGVHIITATLGRLIDLISHDKIDLSNVDYLVIDEAHMMLEMGFLPSVKEIYQKLNIKRQSLFFSATMSPEILNYANELLNNPFTVEIKDKDTNLISQKVCFLYVDNKNALLLELLKKPNKTIIFLRTKYKTDVIEKMLIKNKISAISIHSDKTQIERINAIEDFKSGKIKVLVATDIAARGIHIDDVSQVINYDIPNSPEVYVHRVGRTARAGKSGDVYSFCSLEERELLRNIEMYTGQKMKVIKHSYYAEKVKGATLENIVPTIKKKKNNHKTVSKRSSKNSDEYVAPINKKKSKKPRGIHIRKSKRHR